MNIDKHQRKHYDLHQRRVERYAVLIDKLYRELADEAVRAAIGVGEIDPEQILQHPTYQLLIRQYRRDFARGMEKLIISGVRREWGKASDATDMLIKAYIPKSRQGRYLGRNAEAVEAFIARKNKGLSLSDRVWNISEQAINDISTALEVGLADGLSAGEISREVRAMLQEPKKLFRRVKGEDGLLHLSKSALSYRPGQGVYRSSYKNAMRLARTETNMAYRTSEQERWQTLDFVVGYWVKRSGTGYPCELCDSLAGKYPKTFKWATWHPQCRCYAVPILKTEDELFDLEPSQGGQNEVKEIPQGFVQWVESNKERIQKAERQRTAPYWVRDNKDWISPTTKPTALERAKLRHEARTKEQEEEIKLRAWTRELSIEAPHLTDAERTAIARNWIEIEKELGIKKGKMMSYEDANSGAENPRYGEAKGYSVNCQTCTIVHSLRRAGFDVEAHPNVNGSAFRLMDKNGITWMERFLSVDGRTPPYNFSHRWLADKGYSRTSYGRLEEYLAEQIAEDGLYEIYCGWRGTSSAHVFCAEKKGGTIKYFDPQTGNNDVSKYKLKMDTRKVGVIRVDNKIVNLKALGLVLGKK